MPLTEGAAPRELWLRGLREAGLCPHLLSQVEVPGTPLVWGLGVDST